MHTRRYSSNKVPDHGWVKCVSFEYDLTWPAPLMEGLHVGAVIEAGTVLRVSEETITRIYKLTPFIYK